jgi:hypothetical protein
MWKSLRIGAVLALVAVGALKLAQYEAAKGELKRLSGSLAPALKLGYSSVTGALDGRVILEEPKLEVLAGPASGAVLRATRATIEPVGTLWLLRRAISSDAGVPPALDIHLEGATLSEAHVDGLAQEGWFGPASLVPFESVGCEPVSVFSARDYARMGVATRAREDDVRYSYDPATKALHVDLVSTAPPFSTVNARVDLSAFEPRAWLGDAHAARATRVEQLALTYQDGGYLAQRNRFCAQLTNSDAASYAARHVAAVKSFLEARGIVPGEEVAALYGKLVSEGGSAELSSLPEAAFVPADFASYAPDDALRQLNVTLRRNTAPPILMRLAFAEPAPGAANEALVATAADAPTTTPASGTLPATADPTASTLASATGASPTTLSASAEPPSAPATIEPVRLPEPAKSEGLPLLSVANAAVLPIETAPAPHPEVPAEVLAVATAPAAVAGDGAASLVNESATMPWSTQRPAIDPRNAVEAIPASAPPPTPGSTAALVWRAPTIERLPEKSAATSAWMSVSAGSLGAWRGAYVRVLTAGGKVVEGRVRSLDAGDLVLAVSRDGGSADLHLPSAGIRDAKVRRPSAR